MSVRVKRQPDVITNWESNPQDLDTTQEQRETTVDGYTFHWGPNEVRNFADDGVGAAHAAFAAGNTTVVEDKVPFGDSRS